MKRKRKISPRAKKAAIVAIIAAILLAAVLITNIFIPVKYLSAYLTSHDSAEEGELKVRFLDVGYGDCTIVGLPDGKTMVIDGGDGRYSHELTILNALNSAKIDTVDYLVCTTVKDEHCGGLYEILKYKKVKTVYVPYLSDPTQNKNFERFMDSAYKNAESVKICECGEEVVGDAGYAFTFLSPEPHGSPMSAYRELNSDFSEDSVNGASAILYLEYLDRKFLFLGDAPAAVQSFIFDALAVEQNYFKINSKPINLCDLSVVKASNHCAVNSFSEQFYDLISPDAAIISVGSNGRGAPNSGILSALNKVCKVYRTDVDGDVCVTVNGSGEITLSKEKK